MKEVVNVIQTYNVITGVWNREVVNRGYTRESAVNWAVLNAPKDRFLQKFADVKIFYQIEGTKNLSIIYEYEGVLASLHLYTKQISLTVAGFDREKIEAHKALIKELYPEIPKAKDKVKVNFWFNTDRGPDAVTRQIIVPEWDGISKNYAIKSHEGMEFLTKFNPADNVGQLIIMYGKPGTGKSYSLRALLDAWKDWCNFDYILDPEQLLNGSQNYMAQLVIKGAKDIYEDEDPEEEIETEGEEVTPTIISDANKWKLLILEDSGELLSLDAKARTGQGLSRLLNVVDGLIGQGLKILVLITTNEELKNLHPAVSREGRCAAAIHFGAFDRKAAKEWLGKDANLLPNGQDFTLAELFAIRKEKQSNSYFDVDLKEIGFKMRTPEVVPG